jgi:PAS domain S-box-containing protein
MTHREPPPADDGECPSSPMRPATALPADTAAPGPGTPSAADPGPGVPGGTAGTAARPARGRGRPEVARRYQAIVEQAPDAMLVADREGRILLVNRQTEQLFGYPRQELLGQPVERLIPERFHAAHQQHRAAYVAAPRTRPMGLDLQLFGQRRDGSEFPVDVSLSPLQDEADDEALVITSIGDITSREQRAAERQQHAVERDRALALAHAARTSHELATRQARERAAVAGMTQARDQLEALQALTDTALAHLTLDDLLPEVLDRVVQLLEVDHVAILLLAADGQTLQGRLALGGQATEEVGQVRVPVGAAGFAGRIAATRDPLAVVDLARGPEAGPLLQDMRSALGVPLLMGKRLLGVLQVGTRARRAFGAAEVQLLERAAERIAVALDRVTAYEAAQAAWAEAERQAEQLDQVFEQMADGVAIYDTQGRLVRTNPALRRILGLDAAPLDYAQQPLAERVALYQMRDGLGRPLAPEDVPGARALRGEVVSGSEAVDMRLRALDGREVEVTSSAAPLRDREGRVVGVVSTLRDQTERHRLERERQEALRSSEAWFHTMADTAPVLLWVAGPDTLVTFVNAPWLRFTGRSLEQELGNGWAEGVHPDDYQRCLETYLAAFRARERFTMEYRLRRHDGEHRWVVDTGVPRFAPDGAFLGYIGSAIDITDNKRLERERAEARAGELALREVNRHMDEFLATAAHDLRQPVTGVVMSIDLAERRVKPLTGTDAPSLPAGGRPGGERPGGPASEAQAALGALARARQAAQRLSRLITRLFDVAQAQTGTLELKRERCDLAALVREHVEAQHTMTPERTIRLHLPAAGAVPAFVVADGDRLGEVLTNYLTNALKYSPQDQPVLVSLAVRAGQARVAVRDAGPGLPPEEQRRVWEPFHRAPGVAVQSGAGGSSGSLGLGLHICKTIIERHGGMVGVASEVGEGSTFWFTVPLAAAAATPAAPSDPSAEPSA